MTQGTIFDIKYFAIHDGPGIRTTIFFKGCPLNCLWCHNPEGISMSHELFFYEKKCIHCSNCIQICPKDAIDNIEGDLSLRRLKCSNYHSPSIKCDLCTNECPSIALQLVGQKVSVDDVMDEISKSTIYYDKSQGGVTFSGGEPLMQPEFLNNLLVLCQEDRIHTVLDTSGYASPHVFEGILNKVDLFLYDLKLLNNDLHKRYTGVSNEPIITNLQRLVEEEKDIIIRFPLVPSITNRHNNIEDLLIFLSTLDNIQEIHLLPYHNVSEKYERLGERYLINEDVVAPLNQELWNLKHQIEMIGFTVKIGG